MNKKILSIFLIAVLLMVCAGAVSAADSQDGSNPISVKISWNDAAKLSERPSQVQVDLIKDGNVVDTAVLKESNSWKATFNAQGDGSYSVRASNIDDYSVNVGGSADSGFVVSYSLNDDVLTAVEDESAVQDDSTSDDVLSESENDESGDDILSDDENETDDGEDDTNLTDDDDNATDEDDNATDEDDNATDEDDNATDEEANETAYAVGENIDGLPPAVTMEKQPVDKEKQTPKIVKKPLKKHKIAKSELRNTGLPIAALVIMLGVVAFVPFSRKK